MESKAIGSEFDRAVINKKVREGLPFTDRYHNRFHLEMPFGLINDTSSHVHLFLDENLLHAATLSFHPNDCRGTVVITIDAFLRYLSCVGNSYEFLPLY